jgi:predicted aspartyl protease
MPRSDRDICKWIPASAAIVGLVVCQGLAQTIGPSPGTVLIRAPAGTTYTILGRPENGTAPAAIKLPPGRADVILKREGYADQVRTVQVEENRISEAEWDSDLRASNDLSSDFPTDSVVVRFFTEQGFKPIKLHTERPDGTAEIPGGGHLLIAGAINSERANLLIDTGADSFEVARQRLNKFGLIEKTLHQAHSAVSSSSTEFLGMTTLNLLTIFYPLARGSPDRGTINMRNVPALVLRIPYVDGVLGLAQLRMAGAVIDCKEKVLYVAPYGPIERTSKELGNVLRQKGYTSIPLHLNSKHQFAVAGFVNAVSCSVVIDTGSTLTMVDSAISQKAGLIAKSSSSTVTMAMKSGLPVSTARVKKFSFGGFTIADADVALVPYKESSPQPVALLGIPQLSRSSAIIDVSAGRLYVH